MFVIDTNILVYAADRSCPEHAKCREFLEKCRARSDKWYLTWGIIYEFLRVATHPRVFSQPLGAGDAWKFVEAALASPSLGILVESSRHEETLGHILSEVPALKGNLIHDSHTAALMRENGIKTIVTRDADFYRFPFIQVLDPLK